MWSAGQTLLTAVLGQFTRRPATVRGALTGAPITTAMFPLVQITLQDVSSSSITRNCFSCCTRLPKPVYWIELLGPDFPLPKIWITLVTEHSQPAALLDQQLADLQTQALRFVI